MRRAILRPTGERRVRCSGRVLLLRPSPHPIPSAPFQHKVIHIVSLTPPWVPPRGLRIPPARPPWAHTGRPNRGLQKERFPDELEMPRRLQHGTSWGPFRAGSGAQVGLPNRRNRVQHGAQTLAYYSGPLEPSFRDDLNSILLSGKPQRAPSEVQKY